MTKHAALIFGLFGVVLMAAHIRTMISIVGMDQARQVFALLAPFGILIAGGILRLTRRCRTLVVNLFVFGMIAIGWVSWLGVASAYWMPASPREPIFASSSVFDFGETIRVVNYQIEQVMPGGSVTVRFHWQALSNPTENYWLSLHLTDQSGVIATKDGVPSAGWVTTDWWQKGQIFESSYTLVVPSDVPSGIYKLQVGLRPFGRWNWLPVDGQDMLILGDISIGETRP